MTCALVHDNYGNINAKKKVPACVHACQNRQKNTDIGAAKVGPAMAGLAGPVPPPLCSYVGIDCHGEIGLFNFIGIFTRKYKK